MLQETELWLDRHGVDRADVLSQDLTVQTELSEPKRYAEVQRHRAASQSFRQLTSTHAGNQTRGVPGRAEEGARDGT